MTTTRHDDGDWVRVEQYDLVKKQRDVLVELCKGLLGIPNQSGVETFTQACLFFDSFIHFNPSGWVCQASV